jgi:hypothetical protein
METILLLASIVIAKRHKHKPRRRKSKKHKTRENHDTCGCECTIDNGNTTVGIPVGIPVLYSGTGLGTYYYDYIGKTCNGDAFYQENNGYTQCESFTPGPFQKQLKDRQNNNIVAIDNLLLSTDRQKYCGKRVIVSHNGIPINNTFVVWDGCVACQGGKRLDFSVSELLNIEPDACRIGIVPNISWKVVDEVVIPFVP